MYIILINNKIILQYNQFVFCSRTSKMKRRKEINNINYILFYVSCVHWLLSIWTDKLIFSLDNISNIKYWVVKVLFFSFVFFIWKFIYVVLKKVKTKDEKTIKWISYSIIYAVVLCVILVCVWPGYGELMNLVCWET